MNKFQITVAIIMFALSMLCLFGYKMEEKMKTNKKDSEFEPSSSFGLFALFLCMSLFFLISSFL